LLRCLGERARNMRIFALGIDKAVNEGFLRQLAGLGNGSHDVVESEERLGEVMESIHRRICDPVLTGVAIEADGFEIVPNTVAPGRLPDLFSGSTLFVTGRCRGPAPGALVLKARDATGQPWFATVPVRRSHNPAIGSMWARARVRELEDQFAVAREDRGLVEKQIVETSLRFGVLCRFTSFVAVDRASSVNPGGLVEPVVQAVESPLYPSLQMESIEMNMTLVSKIPPLASARPEDKALSLPSAEAYDSNAPKAHRPAGARESSSPPRRAAQTQANLRARGKSKGWLRLLVLAAMVLAGILWYILFGITR
jgi:Ca-activated chloride channel family protein